MSALPRTLLLVLALVAAPAPAPGSPGAAAYFATPQFDAVRLSPSGEFYAALVAAGHGRRLLVATVERDRARLLRMPVTVRNYHWATDERLLLVTGDPGEAPGLAAVNRDGGGFRVLAPGAADGAPREGVALLDALAGQPASVLITDDRRRAGAPDVYRLDIFQGRRELVARNPGRVFRWWTDRRGRVRLALSWSGDPDGLHYSLRHRFGDDGDWQTLHRAGLGGPFITPLAFDTDDRHLYVAANLDRDTTAVRRLDTVSMELGEVVHARPGADVAAMDLAPDGAVAAVRYETGRPVEVHPGGRAPAEDAWLDSRLPGLEHRVVSRSRDGARAVVLAYGDREPGRYYLLREKPFRLELLGARLPWLEDGVGPRRPVSFQSRDGRRLTGYLSLPAQESGGELPLLVMPHGGPWARDRWGFDAPAQYLASRGFAVLQVNFRGSRGLGREHLMAGRGEWDGAILDDLADGVSWAVQRGIADADRVGILGASFGGYAALMSAVRYPELYRSAASFAAVTDLPRQLQSLRDAGMGRAWREWRVMVGDPAADEAALVNASPLNYARALELPVLLAHGAVDRRVDVAHTVALARAMEAAGRPPGLLLMEGVGHGLEAPGASAGFYRRAAAFMHRALSL